MIYTTHQSMARYRGISKNLDTAIDFIASGRMDSLVPGRNAIDGDQVYAMSFAYETIPASEGFFEAHQQYADIHILLAGEESIDVTPTSQLTELARVEADDFIKLQGATAIHCPLVPGYALLVYPEDAHMVKLQTNGPCQVRKVVVKVKV